MNKKKSILLIGPFPKPVSGLSLANEILYKGLKKKNRVGYIDMSYDRFEENLGKLNIHKIIYFLNLNLKAIKIYNYDSIYLTIGQSFFGVIKYALFFIVSKLLRKKITIHLHGNQLGDMYKAQSNYKKRLVKSILSLSNYGIVLSSSLKHNLKPFIKPENIFVIENFVENELYLNSKEINSKNYASLRIVYIGNLMTEKGVFFLLDALVSLKKKGVVFKAKFAGNIDDQILDSVMSYFKGNDNLEYLGVVRNKEKKELLKWANTFVFPSYLIEGFPLSILEAIVTRNSVITTKHPALGDFFTEENLVFIKEKSSKDIVSSLTKQNLSFDKKRILNNFNVIKGFTEEEFVSKIEKIINL